jgi:hypothetical protein
MAARIENEPPSSDDFKRALQQIAPIAEHHRQILKAHYHAPDYTTTVTELAKSVGYASFNAVNLHHGTLVNSIADRLGLPSSFDLIQTVSKPQHNSEEHLQLTLRPEFVRALDELRW